MTIYLITFDEVFNFETFDHTPRAFADKDKAMTEFESITEDARIGFAEGDWVTTEGDNFFEAYPEGYWGTSHYGVYLQTIEVEE